MHVVPDPQLDEATEQKVVAMITTACDIVVQLKETSSDVIDLMCELKTPVTEYRREVIEDQLKHEFRVALKGSVPPGMATPLASSFARNAVKDVIVVVAVRGDSIVIYFLCITIEALHNLREMTKSGFMDSVFGEIINSETATPRTVRVYVRDEDFDSTLSVLSSAQGWLFDRQLLILKLKGISNAMLKLS